MDQIPDATSILSFWQLADAALPKSRISSGGPAIFRCVLREQEAAGRRPPWFPAALSVFSSSNNAVAISYPVNVLFLVEGRALSDNACHHPNLADAYTPEQPFLYPYLLL